MFFFSSFIRLCDYLVITMLHDLSVSSAKSILETLEQQTAKSISIGELVQPIPDTIEEQEQLLQVLISKGTVSMILLIFSNIRG